MLALLAALQLGATAPSDSLPLPFAPGERFEYTVKLGIVKMGSAHMEVVRPDTAHGAETYLLRMAVRIGSIVYSSNDTLDSWFDPERMVSRRFEKRTRNSGEKSRNRRYEIFPEQGYYHSVLRDTSYPTPPDALDDVSFLYVVRTMPLELGRTYEIPRYFRVDDNPLVVKVLKRETMELPGGEKVPCLVLQPVIGSSGIFAKKARARLWLTDDAR
ncbi:MAG TPA: DUF3108 domain-containing protein, partial [Gemmatimonadales bacterium]|nr:DUF3108 domain-containing protein [Gemmatimonadales bacterium]